jgi:hypothetical protein
VKKREIAVLEAVLADPENEGRTAEQVAERCVDALSDYTRQLRAEEVQQVAERVIEAIGGEKVGGIPARIASALDAMRAKTHRLAVVGQIQYGPQEPVHTVVLGPFSLRGNLDSDEKFRKALEGPLSAREAGQALAWDPMRKKGRGRFMLAPILASARDAWDFYRGDTVAEEVIEAITVLPRSITPACLCGLKHIPACRFCGQVYEHHCPQHEPEAPIHRCATAA